MAQVRLQPRPLLSQLLAEHLSNNPAALNELRGHAAKARFDPGALARLFDHFPLVMTEKQLQERLLALRKVCDDLCVDQNNLARGRDKLAVGKLINQWIDEIIDAVIDVDGQVEKQLATLLNWSEPLKQSEIYSFLVSGLNVIWQNVLNAWSQAEKYEGYDISGGAYDAEQKKNAALSAIFLYANAQQVCDWIVSLLREKNRVVNTSDLNKLSPTDWQKDLLRSVKKPEVAVSLAAGMIGALVTGFMLFSRGMAPIDDNPPDQTKPNRSTPP